MALSSSSSVTKVGRAGGGAGRPLDMESSSQSGIPLSILTRDEGRRSWCIFHGAFDSLEKTFIFDQIPDKCG